MVIEPIVWRRSVREYSQEPVLDEAVESLIRAAQFSPTAMGRREVEFVVVKKQSVKKELADALGQDFIKKAPVLILMAADPKATMLPEYDLAIASGFIMIQAAALGLGTVWKHIGEGGEREEVRKILGLPKDHLFVNIIPVGYPATDLPDHGDEEFDPGKIHIDKY
jgi:nitroreductase